MAGAAERGVGAAPPKRPTGREFRRVAAIQARTLSAGQTRKVLRPPSPSEPTDAGRSGPGSIPKKLGGTKANVPDSEPVRISFPS